MKQELKKVVKNYVEEQELSNEQLQSLAKIISAKHENNKSTNLLKYRAVAAALIASIALGLFWGMSTYNQANISQSIAEEVSYNHLRMKPMEVSSQSMDEVRAYFTNINFSLTPSRFVADNNLQLIGGRYCSILGETAAQLRMQDQVTGDIQIVYQAPYNKSMFRDLPKLQEGQEPVRHFVNGIGVDVWVEKGILFARSFGQ
ncbi:MAG: hypothetical protein R8G33_12205 [Gammaproteobacteria bacterium]|nr:hypothetical protein [Gammaproteobacteria bacterium]